MQAFEIAADATRLTLILVDYQNAGRLAGAAGSDIVNCAHALARRLALAQLISDHLVLGQRTHARQQLQVVHRLGEEVVGAGAEAAQAILALVQRRHQHDRNMLGTRIVLQLPARINAVHFRHHDVHQDDVRLLGQRLVDGVHAIHSLNDVEVFVAQLVVQQPAVLLDIVDDENACTHDTVLRGRGVMRGGGVAPRGPVSFFTSLMKAVIWIGFDIYASQPASRTRRSSWRIAKAVTAMMGMSLMAESSLIQRVRSSPETSGSWMSMMIRSGLCSRARSTAFSPSRLSTV